LVLVAWWFMGDLLQNLSRRCEVYSGHGLLKICPVRLMLKSYMSKYKLLTAIAFQQLCKHICLAKFMYSCCYKAEGGKTAILINQFCKKMRSQSCWKATERCT